MKTAGHSDSSTTAFFVVEMDGEITSQYGIFLEALKAGMELKRNFFRKAKSKCMKRIERKLSDNERLH